MLRHSLLAPVAITFAMLLFALGDNFVPRLADSMSVWQYHALRAALILPVMWLTMAIVGQIRTIRVHRPWAVMARSCFSITALFLYFSAIPAVSVPLAAAGLFSSPIFVVLISVLWFRERVGTRRILAMAVGFVGVCLVLNVGMEPLRPMAIAPIIGGAFYALSVIWTNRYCTQESAGALAVWNMTTFLIFGCVGMLITPWLAGAIGHIEGTAFLVKAPRPAGSGRSIVVAGNRGCVRHWHGAAGLGIQDNPTDLCGDVRLQLFDLGAAVFMDHPRRRPVRARRDRHGADCRRGLADIGWASASGNVSFLANNAPTPWVW